LVTADHEHGLTRTDFRRLPKSEKIALMVEWFCQNYEDPAEHTPYETAEGGFQYVWGGPYDANDEIGSKFGGLVPDKWIEEAVHKVEIDGILEWAPVRTDSDYDDEPIPEPPLDDIADEAGPAYGTVDDYAARKKAASALDDLIRALDPPRPIGIGHNRPPEDVDTDETDSSNTFRPFVEELRDEFDKPAPSIPLIKRLACRLWNGMISATNWAGRKLDIVMDEALKTTGKAVAVAAVASEPHLHSVFAHAYDAVVNWLHVVTSTAF
jgi:hypothetical protein